MGEKADSDDRPAVEKLCFTSCLLSAVQRSHVFFVSRNGFGLQEKWQCEKNIGVCARGDSRLDSKIEAVAFDCSSYDTKAADQFQLLM